MILAMALKELYDGNFEIDGEELFGNVIFLDSSKEKPTKEKVEKSIRA